MNESIKNKGIISSNLICKKILKNIKFALAVLGKDHKILYCNSPFLDIFSQEHEDIEGKNFFDLIDKENIFLWKKAFTFALKNEDLPYILNYKNSSNKVFTLKSMFSVSKTKTGKVSEIVLQLDDLTEEKKAEAKIKFLGFHDSLTGLYNRAFFDEELIRLDNTRNYPLALIMADLNGFKLLNDVFGHLKGDEVLKQTADLLLGCCRKGDVIARYGGDEFTILLPKTDEKILLKVIERIKKSCCSLNKNPSLITISLGSAVKYEDNISIKELIAEAESDMYKAKIEESREAKKTIFEYLNKSFKNRKKSIGENLKSKLLIADRLAKSLGLGNKELSELKLLIKLHDIGIITIPEDIISKPGFLNSHEKKIIQKHCESGYRIAESSRSMAAIADAILHHHENWDGSGYPKGLKWENIPILSRIVAIISTYDAMVHDRPYRKALSTEEAKSAISKLKGKQFDPVITDYFLYYINF